MARIPLTLFMLALPLLAEPVALAPQGPWMEKAGAYRLEYDGKNYANLSETLAVQPETHYRFSWRMKASVSEPVANFLANLEIPGLGTASQGFAISDAWNEYQVFFHSGSANNATLKLYCNPMAAKTIEIQRADLSPVPTERFRKNLVPEGGFEGGAGIPALWRPSYGTPVLPAFLTNGRDFLAGERYMVFTLRKQEKGAIGMQTAYLPMVPGKSYRLSFWAKADTEALVTGGVNGWSPFKHVGGHWYKGAHFKVTPTWGECSLAFDIPDDFTAFPDLQSRLMAVTLSSRNNEQTATVFVDHFVLRQVEKGE